MQQGRAVAVKRRLGVAGGATGVAHARGGVLVQFGPVVGVGLRFDPRLIAHQVGDARVGRQFVGVAQSHPMLHGGAQGVDVLEDGQKRHVKTQHMVFGMVDDPSNLLGVQTRVQGVQDTATAADTKINFQMPVAVPSQRGNPRTLRHLPSIDGMGDLAGAFGDRGPVAAVDVTLDAT